jgi:hypothetical protein
MGSIERRMRQTGTRVLGFDSWTKGAHHFERLVPALAKSGITLQLVHLGSWGNDPGRPVKERFGALDVRDIASYGSDSFERLLDVEQPDVVIFLSIETFAHRAFIRYCRKRSIPTLLLYHGLVNVQVTNDERGSYRINRVAYARFVWTKLGKLIRKTFPCYIASLLKTHAEPEEWIRFASDVMRMAVGKTSLTKVATDAKTSKCAVYANADTEHAVRTYGFDAEDVRSVGNPDLARFGLTKDMLGSRIREGTSVSREVMYLDTGLPAMGLIFKSQGAYLDHLVRTSVALAAGGYVLLLKPHPAHDPEFLRKNLTGSGITVVSNADFVTRLRNCAACITETTTLAMIPALMGMPLLYANYDALEQLRFGPVLTSYPRGYMLESLDDLPDILTKGESGPERDALSDWIDLNVGPLPAEEMPQRVADIVAAMMREYDVPEEESGVEIEQAP